MAATGAEPMAIGDTEQVEFAPLTANPRSTSGKRSITDPTPGGAALIEARGSCRPETASTLFKYLDRSIVVTDKRTKKLRTLTTAETLRHLTYKHSQEEETAEDKEVAEMAAQLQATSIAIQKHQDEDDEELMSLGW